MESRKYFEEGWDAQRGGHPHARHVITNKCEKCGYNAPTKKFTVSGFSGVHDLCEECADNIGSREGVELAE